MKTLYEKIGRSFKLSDAAKARISSNMASEMYEISARKKRKRFIWAKAASMCAAVFVLCGLSVMIGMIIAKQDTHAEVPDKAHEIAGQLSTNPDYITYLTTVGEYDAYVSTEYAKINKPRSQIIDGLEFIVPTFTQVKLFHEDRELRSDLNIAYAVGRVSYDDLLTIQSALKKQYSELYDNFEISYEQKITDAYLIDKKTYIPSLNIFVKDDDFEFFNFKVICDIDNLTFLYIKYYTVFADLSACTKIDDIYFFHYQGCGLAVYDNTNNIAKDLSDAYEIGMVTHDDLLEVKKVYNAGLPLNLTYEEWLDGCADLRNLIPKYHEDD